MLIGALTPGDPCHPGNALTGAQDHASPDPFAEQRIGAADVAPIGRRHGGGLEPEAAARIASAASATTAFAVSRRFVEREIERLQVQLDADHVRGDDAKRLVEELLAGLITAQDRDGGHGERVRRHLDAATRPRDAIIASVANSVTSRGEEQQEHAARVRCCTCTRGISLLAILALLVTLAPFAGAVQSSSGAKPLPFAAQVIEAVSSCGLRCDAHHPRRRCSLAAMRGYATVQIGTFVTHIALAAISEVVLAISGQQRRDCPGCSARSSSCSSTSSRSAS